MKATKITVVAAPGRVVPLPLAAMRSPTGATVRLHPAGYKPAHDHELAGPVEVDTSAPEVGQYIRKRIAAGDLRVVTSSAPASPAPLTTTPTKG